MVGEIFQLVNSEKFLSIEAIKMIKIYKTSGRKKIF